MKNLSEKTLIALLVTVTALTACNNKRTEELNAVKKELIAFEQGWKTDQKELSSSSADLKDDLKVFASEIQELTELTKSGIKKSNSELNQSLGMANASLDSLRTQMDSLNAYIANWSTQSKALNALITQLNEETIEPNSAREQIASLRAFQSKAEPKLKYIEAKVANYQKKQEELKRSLDHLKKAK